MALDVELLNLKSAGTYRFERDKSEISNELTTVSNMRLVVGFSKMGPFNTAKLVTSTAQFIKLYGNIDRSLEKKGSFFHRSALVALSEGPILCLNLMNLDPDRDQVMQKSFSVNCAQKNSNTITLPLQSLYNTGKFWYPSDEAYLDAIDMCLKKENMTSIGDNDWNSNILHFANIGKKPLSILVKKASEYSSKGYELTLNEWYGEENVPEYLNGTSYVSDYLVEVYVVGGDFGEKMESTEVTSSIDLDNDNVNDGATGDTLKMYTPITSENPYRRFSADVVYQSYFDEKGFIRGTNDSNLNKFLTLPSVNLRAKYVGSLIPNFTDKLGRNIWIQKLVNDDTETVGLLCTENISLIENIKDANEKYINENIDIIGNNIFARLQKSYIDSDDSTDDIEFLSYKFSVNIDNTFEDINYIKDVTGYTYQNGTPVVVKDNQVILSSEDAKKLHVGDYLLSDSDLNNGDDGGTSRVTRILEIRTIKRAGEIFKLVVCADKIDLTSHSEFGDGESENSETGSKTSDVESKAAETGSESSDGESEIPEAGSETSDGESEIPEAGSETSDGESKAAETGSETSKAIDLNNTIVKINPIDKVADHLHWTYLAGYKVSDTCMPDGTNKRQNEILDMLREQEDDSDKPTLFKALIDRDYVQWRYLVDTFGLGIESECKSVYTKLCQARKSALAIINCPSQMDFKKSIDPSFTNRLGGVEAEYIAKGGDSTKNPTYLFTLPSIENGASWGAYYYPYLKVADLSAVKSVPPAAYVSNLYLQKYSRGFAWSIVAGQKRGVISGNQVVGVESTLVHDNRDWLEPAGINSIIWESGIGVEVYANKTAKQTPVSALSSIHVREAAIYIQDGVENILRRYVFEFNTAQTRLEIKTLVDEFLNTMKYNGGIYDFRTVMDTTNNTPEVIDNNRGIIDIYVEIVRGLEIIAQRLTILRTGAIEAGGGFE